MSDRYEATGSEASLAAVCGMAAVVLSGFALSDVWGWFVVPLGVPAIGFYQALGLHVMVGHLCRNVARQPRTQEEYMLRSGTWLAAPLLFWGASFLIHVLGS
jgi:hypothetical protein